jgi:hypothetical protein
VKLAREYRELARTTEQRKKIANDIEKAAESGKYYVESTDDYPWLSPELEHYLKELGFTVTKEHDIKNWYRIGW